MAVMGPAERMRRFGSGTFVPVSLTARVRTFAAMIGS
jgi:hypothetical protein